MPCWPKYFILFLEISTHTETVYQIQCVSSRSVCRCRENTVVPEEVKQMLVEQLKSVLSGLQISNHMLKQVVLSTESCTIWDMKMIFVSDCYFTPSLRPVKNKATKAKQNRSKSYNIVCAINCSFTSCHLPSKHHLATLLTHANCYTTVDWLPFMTVKSAGETLWFFMYFYFILYVL